MSKQTTFAMRGILFVCWAVVLWLCCMTKSSECARLPPAPRKLRGRAISPHVIKLRWRDPGRKRGRSGGSRFYSVSYRQKEKEEAATKFVHSSKTRVRLTKLHPNSSYVLSVRSVVGKRGSPWSKAVTVSTPVIEHRVVTKLKAAPLSSESIRLSWKLPRLVNETVAYAILWSELDYDDAERKAVVANGSTSFTFENLRPHRLYGFRVRSMLSEGPGGSTERAIARPYPARPGKAPRGLQLRYVNESHVSVKWLPPPMRQRNGALLGYKIQYKRKGSRHGDLCTHITKPQEKRYALTDVDGGETYKVRVAATTVNGTGPFTKWTSIKIPDNNNTETAEERKQKKKQTSDTLGDEDTSQGGDIPSTPEKLRATEVRSTAVTMTWSQPETPDCCPIVAYRIMSRNLNNTSLLPVELVRGPSTEARVSFLHPDTMYGFNVSAYSIAGESQHSEELIVQTLPAEPPTILAVHGSSVLEGSSVNLTCVVQAEPPPEVSWYGPNKTLPYSNGRITNSLLHREEGVRVIHLHKSSRDVTSHLLVDRVTLQQSGPYSCVAKNSAGSVRMPVLLQVNVAPAIVESAGLVVLDGEPGLLLCRATGTPLPDVVWFRENSNNVFEERNEDGGNLPPTSPFVSSMEEPGGKVRKSYLHFPPASLSDQGNYTCLARSVAGTAESKMVVQINIPPPPAVQNLRAIALSPQSMSVVWDPPFDYHYVVDGYRLSYRQVGQTQSRYLDTQALKHDIQGLEPRQSYVVSVVAYNWQSMGAAGKEVTITTLSNEGLQPANVSAVALNSSMIQLDWGSSQNIDRIYILGYNIYYRRENETREEMLFIEGNRNKQFLIGLGRDETYYLRIATVTTWGFEASSQWIRIQKHPEELLPPTPPQDIRADATVNSIRVSWTPSSELTSSKSPLLGYRMIYGPVDKPSDVERVRLEPTATQFTIGGLSSSTLYIIALRAFNKYAMSEPVYVRAATKAQPPSTVINATAQALSATEIHVHWHPPARGRVTTYQLRYWRPGKRDKQSAWLTAPTTDYVAGSLKQFSGYRFEIIPYSNDVIGEGSVIFADTRSSRPGAPPQDVAVTIVNVTRLLVTWKPPLEGKRNGIINGYKLILKEQGGPRLAKFSVDWNRFNYTFQNLKPGTTYKVRMAAMNSNGTGPFSEWVVSQTEHIEMRQPESPGSLKIEESSHSVELMWTAPRDIGVPVLGYIVGYGRYIPEVYRIVLAPKERSYVIKDLKPSTEYIVSVRAFNHMGESVPQFSLVHTLSAPPILPLEVPVKLRVVPLSPNDMSLTWLDPALLKRFLSTAGSAHPGSPPPPLPSDSRVYMIRYSAISGEEYQYLYTTNTSLNVSGLDVATSYEFAVRTTRGDEKSGWSLPVVNTTQQTAPSTAPSKVTVLASPSASPSLLVNWSEPSSPNGDIEEYIVYYTSEPTADTKFWMLKTTTKLGLTIGDITPHTSYYVKVQARNAAGYGPLSDTVVYNPPTDFRAAPREVTVWSLDGNISTAVEVMWRKPELSMGHITGFMVYYTLDNNQSDSNWMIQMERGLSALILELIPNTTYYFKVRARYGAGLGPFSDVVSFITPPGREDLQLEEEVDKEEQDQDEGSTTPETSLIRAQPTEGKMQPPKNRTQPSKTRSQPFTQPPKNRTQPSKTSSQPSTKPPRSKTQPSKTRSQPSTQPPKNRTQPSKTRSQPSTQPPKNRTQPSKTSSQPSTQPPKNRTQPSKTRSQPPTKPPKSKTQPSKTSSQPSTQPPKSKTQPSKTRSQPPRKKTQPSKKRTQSLQNRTPLQNKKMLSPKKNTQPAKNRTGSSRSGTQSSKNKTQPLHRTHLPGNRMQLPPVNLTLEVGIDHVNATWDPPVTSKRPTLREDNLPLDITQTFSLEADLISTNAQPVSSETDLPLISTEPIRLGLSTLPNITEPISSYAKTSQPIRNHPDLFANTTQPLSHQLGSTSQKTNLQSNLSANTTQAVSYQLELKVNSTEAISHQESPPINPTQPVSYQADMPVSDIQPISYHLELWQWAEKDELVAEVTLTETTHTFTQLDEDTNYVIKVMVIGTEGQGAPAVQAFRTFTSQSTVDKNRRRIWIPLVTPSDERDNKSLSQA